MGSVEVSESSVTVIICFSSLKGKKVFLNLNKCNNLKCSKIPKIPRLNLTDINSEGSKGTQSLKTLQFGTHIIQ